MMHRTHYVRSALVHALRAGAVGTFDVLARHAGLSPEHAPSAQITLANMAREGKVIVTHTQQAARTPGRPRAVYALASAVPPYHPSVELGRTLCVAWR
jgi:hypothetical protein